MLRNKLVPKAMEWGASWKKGAGLRPSTKDQMERYTTTISTGSVRPQQGRNPLTRQIAETEGREDLQSCGIGLKGTTWVDEVPRD